MPLVLCLNIDVDPPDFVKTNPCAVLECWIDPHTMPSNKALEAIGSNVQHQSFPYKPIPPIPRGPSPFLSDLARMMQR